MQYALFPINNAPFRPLLDTAELYALEQGETALIDHQPNEDYEQTLETVLVYGAYMPQPDFEFPKDEIKRHIKADINHWLVHLKGTQMQYLAIEDIEPFYDVTITTSCGHCPKPHATPNVAFAALMYLPKDFEFGSTHAKTAYCRWFNMDALTNALNRKGLYALIASDKRFSSALTKENWRERIDTKRAIRLAQKWR
ncbi:hypothetical protein [Vibrio sp. K4]|uniref:hypothetical protein n=1 Tax=Vibrio sp. K4 TaxID=3391579 RepID=UPI003DA6E482